MANRFSEFRWPSAYIGLNGLIRQLNLAFRRLEEVEAGVVTETDLSFSDITTANSDATKHGLLPKLPADATKYLNGTGAFTVPSGGWWTDVAAASNSDVSTNTTPANDAELMFDMVAGGVYQFEAFLVYGSPAGGGTPDFKYNWAGPATLTGLYNPVLEVVLTNDAVAPGYTEAALTTTSAAGTATTPRVIWSRGWASSSGGGTGASGFRLQWSQNTSDANATRRYAGSILRYRRLV